MHFVHFTKLFTTYSAYLVHANFHKNPLKILWHQEWKS